MPKHELCPTRERVQGLMLDGGFDIAFTGCKFATNLEESYTRFSGTANLERQRCRGNPIYEYREKRSMWSPRIWLSIAVTLSTLQPSANAGTSNDSPSEWNPRRNLRRALQESLAMFPYAAGYNDKGELGDGTDEFRSSPVHAETPFGVNEEESHVYPSSQHSFFMLSANQVYASGYNNYGQLGDGTNTDRLAPAQVLKDLEIRHISVGGFHSLFCTTEGHVYATGQNNKGQLGLVSDIKDTSTPVSPTPSL
ncbi:hypothetical protein CYMTET_37510 [Cymbomonas tetramitiformis]|uniref:Uncharacterized protein n=1 Tax=Cymbomonas tetramitiformis TaxID=36881 RepID=A0AAE0CFK1_9CHLO|nr:hypothetical protein CYMTET_37510 [Cymbomonas tetramitiformis]